jgi:hypothetical protein
VNDTPRAHNTHPNMCAISFAPGKGNEANTSTGTRLSVQCCLVTCIVRECESRVHTQRKQVRRRTSLYVATSSRGEM